MCVCVGQVETGPRNLTAGGSSIRTGTLEETKYTCPTFILYFFLFCKLKMEFSKQRHISACRRLVSVHILGQAPFGGIGQAFGAPCYQR